MDLSSLSTSQGILMSIGVLVIGFLLYFLSSKGKKYHLFDIVVVLLLIGLTIAAYYYPFNKDTVQIGTFDYNEVPAYEGQASIPINNNVPYFTKEEITYEPYEEYGELDSLGRCTSVKALLDLDMMPTEEREEIKDITPSGYQVAKYDDLIQDGFLYNRCHLIAYSLSAENANERNLITGTRYMNIEGMQPYELKISSYIHRTGNPVLYRVTPIFLNRELVARGVLLEAYSVLDDGEGIEFCVYCYNVQPGIEIDYATGNSSIKN